MSLADVERWISGAELPPQEPEPVPEDEGAVRVMDVIHGYEEELSGGLGPLTDAQRRALKGNGGRARPGWVPRAATWWGPCIQSSGINR